MGKAPKASGSKPKPKPKPVVPATKAKVKSGAPYPKAKPSKTKPASKPQPQPKPKASTSTGDKGKARARASASPIPIPTLAPVLPSYASTFKLIVGSYEKNLYGLSGSLSSGPDGLKADLTPIFIFPAHLATIKCVAASPGGKWLATGSEDEVVKVWDLKRRKEIGGLSQHQGSITYLHFPTKSHLVSSSDDSTLSLFRVRDWALLRSLKGHSGRINGFDVHPTGRVALSVGKDKTLKMWDLMRGRGAASLALGREAEQVKFSPLGTHFAVLSPQSIEIYSLDMHLLETLETKRRFHDLKFASIAGAADSDSEQEVLLVATEEGKIECYTVEILTEDEEDAAAREKEEEAEKLAAAQAKGDDDDDEEDEDDEPEKGPKTVAIVEKIAVFAGHTNRYVCIAYTSADRSVKSISALELYLPGTTRKTTIVASCSSDGKINVYDLAAAGGAGGEEILPVASYDTEGSRLICVTLADDLEPSDGAAAGPVKAAGMDAESGARFQDDEDEEEDEDEDEEEGLYEGSQEEDEEEEEEEEEDEDEDEVEME